MTLTTAASSQGALLRMWRASAQLTIEQLVSLVNDQLAPADQISRRTLRRYESDDYPPERAHPVVLAAIAGACGRKTTELPEAAQEGLAKSATAIARSRCRKRSSQRAA